MRKTNGKALCAVLLAVLAGGCATGPGGDLQLIGETNNGNIKSYLYKSSVQRHGRTATFQEKKEVVKMSEERFVNTPAYKTAIGDWEIDCTNKTYRLKALKLMNERGGMVGTYSFSSVDLRPLPIPDNTLVYRQYQAVCLHNAK